MEEGSNRGGYQSKARRLTSPPGMGFAPRNHSNCWWPDTSAAQTQYMFVMLTAQTILHPMTSPIIAIIAVEYFTSDFMMGFPRQTDEPIDYPAGNRESL